MPLSFLTRYSTVAPASKLLGAVMAPLLLMRSVAKPVLPLVLPLVLSVVSDALVVAGGVVSKTVLARFSVVTLLSVPLSVISVSVTTRLPLMPPAIACR